MPPKDESNGLIEKYLPFYEALRSGVRRPETPAQVQFVQVCRGERPPRTQHELAFMEYLKKKAGTEPPRKAKPKVQQRARRADVASEPGGLSAKDRAIRDKFMPKKTRVISEPWGSREAWKADSGANWSGSRKNRIVD